MANLDLGPSYAEIAGFAARDIRADPEGILLYAAAGDGWVSACLFKDIGNAIICRFGSEELKDTIVETWEAEAPDKRWAIMEMMISCGKFDVDFSYSDEIEGEEFSLERRTRIVASHFGEKPIDYTDR